MLTNRHETIGQKVKSRRKARGLSQTELAEGICSSSTISLLETDQHIPSAEIIQKIADKLGVCLHELIGSQEQGLDLALQLDLIAVLVEMEQYSSALALIDELGNCAELAEYQKRNLTLHLAECLMRTGAADRALELLTELQQKLEQQREADTRLLAMVYNKLGNAYYLSANMAYAHANYLRAYQITLQFPEFDLLCAQICYNLASICRWFGLYAESILHFQFAHDFFAKISDQKNLAHTILSLGLTYKNIGEFNLARHFLQQSLALYQTENMLAMARNARQQYAFYVLGQTEPQMALAELLRCAEEYKALGDTVRQAYTQARVAALYLEQEQFEAAVQAIEHAVGLFDAELAETDPKFPYVYRVYANCFYHLKKYDQAIHYSFLSHEIFSRMALEKEAADSLQIAVNAYRKQDSKDGVIQTLEKVNDSLCRAYEQPLFKLLEEL